NTMSSGPGVDASLASPPSAALDGTTEAPAAVPPPAVKPASTPRDPKVRSLLDRVRNAFPSEAHTMLIEGVRRTIDFQDPAYADLYLDRMARSVCPPVAAYRARPPEGVSPALGRPGAGLALDIELINETARHLALWMTYED